MARKATQTTTAIATGTVPAPANEPDPATLAARFDAAIGEMIKGKDARVAADDLEVSGMVAMADKLAEIAAEFQLIKTADYIKGALDRAKRSSFPADVSAYDVFCQVARMSPAGSKPGTSATPKANLYLDVRNAVLAVHKANVAWNKANEQAIKDKKAQPREFPSKNSRYHAILNTCRGYLRATTNSPRKGDEDKWKADISKPAEENALSYYDSTRDDAAEQKAEREQKKAAAKAAEKEAKERPWKVFRDTLVDYQARANKANATDIAADLQRLIGKIDAAFPGQINPPPVTAAAPPPAKPVAATVAATVAANAAPGSIESLTDAEQAEAALEAKINAEAERRANERVAALMAQRQ